MNKKKMIQKNEDGIILHKTFGIGSNTGYVLGKMWRYCPKAFWLSILAVTAGTILSCGWSVFMKYVIDLLGGAGTAEEKMQRILLFVVAAGAAMILLNVGNTYANVEMEPCMIYARSCMITERVRKVLSMNYQILESPEILDIHERAKRATTGDNDGINGMMNMIATLGYRFMTLIVTLTVVTIVDWRLIFALIILGLIQYLNYQKTFVKDRAEVWNQLPPIWRRDSYMSRVTQDFQYGKDIRLFGLEDFLIKKYREIFNLEEAKIDWHKELWFRQEILGQILYVIGKGLVYAALFYAVFRKDLTIGNFTMVFSMAMTFSAGLLEFLQRFGDYKRVSLQVDDFRSFLELATEEETDIVPIPAGHAHEIEFHDVCFRYPHAEKNALEHLNLKVKAGEKLAVVGLNGAGKTTMIKLMLRLYDPSEGYITLDGTDIRKFKREEYYRIFSPVFQNIELFAFPISENVSMCASDRIDRERVAECLKEAGLEEKVSGLRHGMDTALTNIVEEDGVDLSGGEKQKLALAKALYKNGDIIVLDEPTSALDAIAEERLYESFDKMIGKKTAVYISHRLASTRFCDKIALFEDGRMTEYGSYDELMAKDGEYAKMFRIQAQYYKDGQQAAENDEELVGESGVSFS